MNLREKFEEILRIEVPSGVCDLPWTDQEYKDVARELCEAVDNVRPILAKTNPHNTHWDENWKDIYESLGWTSGSERFYELLIIAGQLHSRKNQDYTRFHPLENFFRVSIGTGLPLEKVVAVFLETKLARIESLLGRDPSNESLMDSYVDLAVYALLGAVLNGMSENEKTSIKNLIMQDNE